MKKNDKYGHKKGEKIPQPKFKRGKKAVIEASVALMKEARIFVESVLLNKEFPGLDYYGKRYWKGFVGKLERL